MREMKDSGVAWIGEIPKEWELKSIRHLLIERNEKNKALSVKTILSLSAKEGVTLYNSENHSGNKPREDLSDYKIVREHDIVVNSMNILSGSVGLSDYEGVVSPVYYIYYPRYEDNIEYMHYIFQCFEFQRSLRGLGNGILIKETESGSLNTIRMRIPSKKLALQELPYCNREEQDRIVMALNSIIKKVDSLITNQQKQIEKLKAYKQSLITETVTKGLNPDVPMKDSGVEWIGEIPKDWEIVRIKNICQFNPSSKKSFSDDDIVSYVPMECVRTGSLVHKEIAIKNVSSGLTYFEENDIIMAKVTPCFENGNIAIATGLTKGMAFGSSELFVFRANESIKFFLFYFLQNNIFKKFSISTMTGTGGLKRVSPNFVNNYSFALPPIEERNKIVFYLDKKCTQIDSLIAIKQRKIEKLQQYKKSLIYEYVTGKKEVK